MIRDLAAPQICLLTLIAVYCDGHVPPDKLLFVTAFITRCIIPPASYSDLDAPPSALLSEQLALSLDGLRENLEPVQVRNGQQNLWQLLVSSLWALNDLDALFEFFRGLEILFRPRVDSTDVDHPKETLQKIELRKSSLVGIFVRRACLNFQKLMFDDAIALWRDFEIYRHPSRRMSQPLVGGKHHSNGDKVLSEAAGSALIDAGHRETQNGLTVDSGKNNRLLEFSLDRMEKLGTRLPNDMRRLLWQVLEAQPTDQSQTHYIRFLDAWYAGDYNTSFDFLHRYYDYAMHNKDRSHYQYALLNMAIMQADFGCYEEAMLAMNEAITAARENKDLGGLNYCLSWLYHMRSLYRANDTKSGVEMKPPNHKELAHLRLISQENKMWSVLSSAVLNEAALLLTEGNETSRVLRRLTESAELNIRYDIPSLNANQTLLASSVYGRLGLACLSDAHNSLVINLYGRLSPAEDLMKARCRQAYALVRQGKIGLAFQYLNTVDSGLLHTLKFHQYLKQFTKLLELKRALHRSHFSLADKLVHSLRAQPVTDPSLAFEVQLLEIDYFARLREFPTAFELVQKLAKTDTCKDTDIAHRIRLMCVKASIFCKAGRAPKGFSLAVRAMLAAWKASIVTLVFEAAVVLSDILNELGDHKPARDVLCCVIEQAREIEDAELLAKLHSALADAYMGIAGGHVEGSVQQKQNVDEARKCLEAAAESFEALEDRDGCQDTAQKLALIRELFEET